VLNMSREPPLPDYDFSFRAEIWRLWDKKIPIFSRITATPRIAPGCAPHTSTGLTPILYYRINTVCCST
jgi:hypothetical protein